ncbi:deoxynucleoside kinase, partial [Salinivibrio sp. VYel6]|uniref:deoxynucleoside kinase n=1 Tax=Salinivibrio sp. VYel6 TaxID=2490493 RepID=UPI001561B9C8
MPSLLYQNGLFRRQKVKGKRIAIEGNIGVGKTTLMHKLPEYLEKMTGGKWEVIDERVDTDPTFQKLLSAYYADPNKRIDLQHWLTQRRIKEFDKLDPEVNYILERSFHSDMVFCHLNLMRHERPSGEFVSYYYDILEAAQTRKYDVVVYLKSTPERCFMSMNGRGREAEAGVPYQYLSDLHSFYECVLTQSTREQGTPLISVPWNN